MEGRQTDLPRIGVLTPPGLRLDYEYSRWADGVASIYFARCPVVVGPMSPERARHEAEPEMVNPATEQLAILEPGVIAFACTMASFVDGIAGERELRELIERSAGTKAVTTSGALLLALEEVGAKNVAIATPYNDEVTDKLAMFLEQAGFSVVSQATLGLEDAIAVADVPSEDIKRLVMEADDSKADAVFISCTNLPTYGLIEQLEAQIGKPVISANQATLWAALRAIGHTGPVPGHSESLFTRGHIAQRVLT